MKQQELKDLKRDLLKMSTDISERHHVPGKPVDEDAEFICGTINNLISQIANRIELKYRGTDNARLYLDMSEDYVKLICDHHPDKIAGYEDVKAELIEFLLGQVMIACKGSCNPKLVSEAIDRELTRRER